MSEPITEREYARETRHMLNNHMQVTGIKLDQLGKNVDARHEALTTLLEEKIETVTGATKRLEGALKWAGGLIISVMIAVMGWSFVQQVNANEATKTELAHQVDLLKTQEQARVQYREEVLSRLPAGAAQTGDATNGLGQNADLRDMRPNNGGKN